MQRPRQRRFDLRAVRVAVLAFDSRTHRRRRSGNRVPSMARKPQTASIAGICCSGRGIAPWYLLAKRSEDIAQATLYHAKRTGADLSRRLPTNSRVDSRQSGLWLSFHVRRETKPLCLLNACVSRRCSKLAEFEERMNLIAIL